MERRRERRRERHTKEEDEGMNLVERGGRMELRMIGKNDED